jgi:hypothetical protein
VRWPRRTSPLPSDQRASLHLDTSDRVLSAARLRDDSWVAATHGGLALADQTLDWSSITQAQWDADAATLTLHWLTEQGSGERQLLVADAGTLPETVYARVTATIVLSRRVTVAGGRGLRVAARRQPGSDELTWQVVPDSGVDPDDPPVQAAVNAALRQMAVELGE